MSYTNPDGSPDTMEGLTLSARCFAAALGALLEENEGMVIELPFQEKNPNDPHGKFSVIKRNKQIHVCKPEEGDEIHTHDHGQMFFLEEDS